MIKHEKKYCPRCKVIFECKVATVELCQCAHISITEQERNYLSEKFEDCLCINCMKELQVEYKFERK